MRTPALLLSATFIFSSAQVLAAPVDVDFLGFAHGSETVNFSVTGAHGAVNAGGFSTSLNGGASFTSYCVDLFQTISFTDPAYHNYEDVLAVNHVFANNTTAAADLSRLYGATAGQVINSKTEAAFQIAAWEIAYETSGAYNLGLGTATFLGGTAATSGALTTASSWLAALGSNQSASVHVLENREHQDVIYATPVPEPETYALMLGGLAALRFAVRRKTA
jgi:hypothetical protein